jgi:hypothetical protein
MPDHAESELLRLAVGAAITHVLRAFLAWRGARRAGTNPLPARPGPIHRRRCARHVLCPPSRDAARLSERGRPVASEEYPERTFGSTTSVWKWSKIRRPPQPHELSASKASTTQPGIRKGWRGLYRVDWHKPVHLTLQFNGGAEGWIEVHARGRRKSYPALTPLIDVLGEVTQQL